MIFRDRKQAGELLAQKLIHQKKENLLVLAIPRGGVVVGDAIAVNLSVPLDIALVRKLGAPFDPELAIGAVSEAGNVYLNQEIIRQLKVDNRHIQKEIEEQKLILEKRATAYRRVRPKVPIKGRPIILTDDGIATGATMFSVIQGIRKEEPHSITVGLPVGPQEVISEMNKIVEEVVCLYSPADFMAVGAFYQVFDQVSDEEVIKILEKYK